MLVWERYERKRVRVRMMEGVRLEVEAWMGDVDEWTTEKERMRTLTRESAAESGRDSGEWA